MRLGKVIAIVGPSGVGKDSVIEALLAAAPNLQRVRRVITRPDGAGAEDFERVSVEEFRRMEDRGAFALSWVAHGLRYGVPVGMAVKGGWPKPCWLTCRGPFYCRRSGNLAIFW